MIPAPHSNLFTRDQIVSYGQALPPAPRIMSQLVEMLGDLDADITDLALLVRVDPELTARVIRLSRTVMFGSGDASGLDNLETSLARVGFENVLSLVGAAGVTQLTPAPLYLYGIDVDTFQQSALCHALAAEQLARRLGENPHSAYVAALLRCLGMIVLDRAVSSLAGNAAVFGINESYADFESRTFGLRSVDVTRVLMDEWNFPEEIIAAVEHHHLDTSDSLSNRLACVVNVAGEIAAAVGYGLPGDAVHWNATPEKYEVLGVTLEFWNEFSGEANRRFEDVCASLKAS